MYRWLTFRSVDDLSPQASLEQEVRQSLNRSPQETSEARRSTSRHTIDDEGWWNFNKPAEPSDSKQTDGPQPSTVRSFFFGALLDLLIVVLIGFSGGRPENPDRHCSRLLRGALGRESGDNPPIYKPLTRASHARSCPLVLSASSSLGTSSCISATPRTTTREFK